MNPSQKRRQAEADDSIGVRVRNVPAAIGRDEDADGTSELAVAVARFVVGAEECAVGAEDQKFAVLRVCRQNATVRRHSNVGFVLRVAVAPPRNGNHAQEVEAAIESLEALVPGIGDIEVPIGPNSYANGLLELSG